MSREKITDIDPECLKKVLKMKKISMRTLATDLRVDYGRLNKDINKGKITEIRLRAICQYLNVAPEVLTGELRDTIGEDTLFNPLFHRFQEVSTPKMRQQIFNDFVTLSAVDPDSLSSEEKNELFKLLIMTVRIYKEEIHGSDLDKKKKRDLLNRLITTVRVFKVEDRADWEQYIL